MREAILTYLDALEDIYLAQQVLEQVKRGEERIYSSKEVEEKLNAMDD